MRDVRPEAGMGGNAAGEAAPADKRPKVYRKPPLPPEEVERALAGIDPIQHLPATLHDEARDFLAWLDTFPDSEPAACPYCGCTRHRIAVRKGPKTPRTWWRCSRCEKAYSVLVGTPLEGLRTAWLWRAFMTLRLAGWSLWPISKYLRTSTHGASNWDRQFLVAMELHAPQLYAWWRPHQEHQDGTMPEPLQRSAEAFVAWVEAMSARPARELEGTPFARLSSRSCSVHFARLLIDGCSDVDMMRELGLLGHTVARARRDLMLVLDDRYSDLAAWIRWQRARRYHEVSEQMRQRLRRRSPVAPLQE